MTYIDIEWTCGGMAHSLKTSHVLPITVTGHWVTEWSTSGSLGKFSQARKATPELYRMSGATLPHVHSAFMYIPACDEFYQAFPRVSTASDKRWVRRPGYEASLNSHLHCDYFRDAVRRELLRQHCNYSALTCSPTCRCSELHEPRTTDLQRGGYECSSYCLPGR